MAAAQEPARRTTRRRRGFGPALSVAWQDLARCRGPQSALFFPPATPELPEERVEREARAKIFCQECRVSSECLEYAVIRNEDFGVWGGLNEAERRLVRAKSS